MKKWDNVQLIFGQIKDWAAGEYKDIPIGSIILIIIDLLYFVSPIDLVPDFIGIIDDTVVLVLFIKQVMSDLDKYLYGKKTNKVLFIYKRQHIDLYCMVL